MDSQSLPVINFSIENLHQGSLNWVSTCNQIKLALEEYGCFIVEFEKTPSKLQLHNEIFKSVKELFDLPTETKMKNVSDKPFHGYLGPKVSPLVPPLRESVGIELGNGQRTSEAVDSFVKLLWPSGNDHYRENVITYSNMVTEMAKLVKKMIFESYGVEKYYDSYIDSAVYLLRNIKYKIPKIGEDKVGTDVHRDKTFITILHENGSKGLEIKTKNGDDWLGVDFSPNSFLVIAGEASMDWSKGRIQSATHRVVMRGTKERYSLGLFSFHKGIIEIPNEFLDDQNPLSFKSFNNYGMLKDYFTDDSNKKDYTAQA